MESITRDSKSLTCYKCKKAGHIRTKCTQLKKKKKVSRKAMKVIWDEKLLGESEDNDQSNEKVANVCLMALADELKDN